MHSISRYLWVFFGCCFFLSLDANYIQRFTTIDNGGIAFTGNAVGLSKCTGENNPGTNDSIGAFISTNQNLQANRFPTGTTLKVEENGSEAFLDLPKSSEVLYAELIWSGSYGWSLENPYPLPAEEGSVTLTTPQLISHQIRADKMTAQNDLTPGFTSAGNYVRTSDVTPIIQMSGGGKYAVGQIPSSLDKMDEQHNAAGWTLAVVYRNPALYTQRLTLWVGCEQGCQSQTAHRVDDFCLPFMGSKHGRLFISAIEGDATRSGDHLLLGAQPGLVYPRDALCGGNNPIDNFFGSQINTLISMIRDEHGKLAPVGAAEIDIRGSFGLHNHDALNHQNVEAGRQGYDITSIDLANKLDHNQTTLYVQGQTSEEDEDYTIGALGVQIQVDAPIIKGIKKLNGQEEITAPFADETHTVTITLENVGTYDAKQVCLKKFLQNGINYIPGTFKINGTLMPDRYVEIAPINDLLVNQSIIIEYKVWLDNAILSIRPDVKETLIDYSYYYGPSDKQLTLCSQTNAIAINR